MYRVYPTKPKEPKERNKNDIFNGRTDSHYIAFSCVLKLRADEVKKSTKFFD